MQRPTHETYLASTYETLMTIFDNCLKSEDTHNQLDISMQILMQYKTIALECGFEVSPLDEAFVTLQKFCDPEKITILDRDIFKRNVIDVLKGFHNKPANTHTPEDHNKLMMHHEEIWQTTEGDNLVKTLALLQYGCSDEKNQICKHQIEEILKKYSDRYGYKFRNAKSICNSLHFVLFSINEKSPFNSTKFSDELNAIFHFIQQKSGIDIFNFSSSPVYKLLKSKKHPLYGYNKIDERKTWLKNFSGEESVKLLLKEALINSVDYIDFLNDNIGKLRLPIYSIGPNSDIINHRRHLANFFIKFRNDINQDEFLNNIGNLEKKK